MALTEFQDLIADLQKLLKQVKQDPPGAHGFVVCLPGTFCAYFNTY